MQQLDDDDTFNPTLSTYNYDLVLWHITALDTDKLERCRQIRQNFDGPLLILSDRHNTKAQLEAFALGADDFIAMPVDPRILLARIHACLRRAISLAPPKSIVQIKNLIVDHSERCAKIGDQTLALSTGEFDILWLLALHPRRALSRDFLFVHALGRQYDGLDRAVDRRVSRLRKKLERRPDISLTVRTIWGRGYMLAAL